MTLKLIMADVIMNWPTPNGMHKLALDVPCPLNSTIFDCTSAITYFNLTYQKKIIHFNLVVDEVPISLSYLWIRFSIL
jgi:hypothetical protein